MSVVDHWDLLELECLVTGLTAQWLRNWAPLVVDNTSTLTPPYTLPMPRSLRTPGEIGRLISDGGEMMNQLAHDTLSTLKVMGPLPHTSWAREVEDTFSSRFAMCVYRPVLQESRKRTCDRTMSREAARYLRDECAKFACTVVLADKTYTGARRPDDKPCPIQLPLRTVQRVEKMHFGIQIRRVLGV